MFRVLDHSVLDLGTIHPCDQNHQYELLGPGRTPPVARVALCGYMPSNDPNDMKSFGGWRDIEQNREDCAECWDEARRRWAS